MSRVIKKIYFFLLFVLLFTSTPATSDNSSTSTITVTATVGPASIEAMVDNNVVYWSAFHISEEDAANNVIFTDGISTITGLDIPMNEYTDLSSGIEEYIAYRKERQSSEHEYIALLRPK